MPARPLIKDRPTVYLDTSTLVNAFSAGAGVEEFAGLARWVMELPDVANLCLSFIHIAELADARDSPRVDALARWLDGLDFTWMRYGHRIAQTEAKYWVKVAAGVEEASPPNVFSPSTLRVMEEGLNLNHASRGLALANVPGVLLTMREAGGMRPLKEEYLRGMGAVRADHEWADHWSDAEKKRALEGNARRDLERYAREAHRALRMCEEYATRTVRDEDAVVKSLRELFDRDPACMPSLRLQRSYQPAAIEAFKRKNPQSKGQQRMASAIGDTLHLAGGGAYCDVFTCDRDAAKWLGGARKRIGREDPIYLDRDPSRFVEALKAAVASAVSVAVSR